MLREGISIDKSNATCVECFNDSAADNNVKYIKC